MPLHGGVEVIESEAWTCPTCKHAITTSYCPGCGECPHLPSELTLRGLIDQAVQALTSIDGRLLRSVWCLIGRPGGLTVAYLEGRRKPYVGPVQLFLIANALFFGIESLTGGTVFTTPLDSHLHTQPWSPVVEALVSHRLAAMHTTLEAYTPVFNRAIAVNARALIMLMALSFVVAPSMLFYRRRPLAAHALFSLHFYAFLLLVLCVATAVPPVDRWLGGAGFASEGLDHAISIAILAVCGLYLYFATAEVYAANGARRVLEVLLLTVAVAILALGYRFALLLITLYSA
jgi:Protein of unknown function (DUF3667)